MTDQPFAIRDAALCRSREAMVRLDIWHPAVVAILSTVSQIYAVIFGFSAKAIPP